MWRMFANICLYLPLILSNSVTRHVDKFDKLRLQLEFICNAYVKMFCKIVFIFIADFLKWCQTRCCWVRWIQISARNHLWCCMWRIFANIYWYLPLMLSNGVTRHVVKYDKLLFQPEIICNAVCKQCLQISIYISPLFSQILLHDMLLSMMNSDFSQNSLVMLCEECLQIFIYFYP